MTPPDDADPRPIVSAADLDAVSDNPEWTVETSARSKSLAEMFPDIPQQLVAGDERDVTLRLEARVIEHYRTRGGDWQRRINDILSDAAGL